MDINSTNGNGHVRAQQRYREAMVELVRRTRGKVQAARDQAMQASNDGATEHELAARPETDKQDRVEISRKHHARISNARSDQAEANAQPDQAEGNARPAEGDSRDRVDISRQFHARLQSARMDAAGGDDMAAKVARLRKAHQAGALNSPEQIQRAAENLLRGGSAFEPIDR